MKKTLTITKDGFIFVDGDKTHKAHLQGEFVNREKGTFSILCGFIAGKDKNGKEVLYACEKGDKRQTKEGFINFRWFKKGEKEVAIGSYHKDEQGYHNVVVAGLKRGSEIGKDEEGNAVYELTIERELTPSKVKTKDGKEVTRYDGKFVEPKAKAPAKKKEADKGEELPF